MKYIIDGIDKQVTTLARLYKYLKTEDEFRLYESTFNNSKVEGLDVLNMSNASYDYFPTETDNDSRRIKVVYDFEKSLDWADCYCTFISIPYIMNNYENIATAESYINGVLDRLNMAISKGKKVYLGNLFSQEFVNIHDTYENCIHKAITRDELDEMIQYSGSFYEIDANNSNVDITMIVGTNSGSGKMSPALDCMNFYKEKGEKVCMVITEELGDFLDNSEGDIYQFCRNFSSFTTDEDFQYLRGLICKIILEKHPDRIIVVTQSGVGVDGVMSNSNPTIYGTKMKNLFDIMIETAFGLNTVVVSTNWNRLDECHKLISYYNIQGVHIDAVYISPVSYNEDYVSTEIKDYGITYIAPPKANKDYLETVVNGFALKYPNVRIVCNYNNITEKVEAFKSADYFKEASAILAAETAVMSAYQYMSAELQEYSRNNLISKIESIVLPEDLEESRKIVLNNFKL